MAGGSLAQWFDVVVHRQELSPAEWPAELDLTAQLAGLRLRDR